MLRAFQRRITSSREFAVLLDESVLVEDVFTAVLVFFLFFSENTFTAKETFCLYILEGWSETFVRLGNFKKVIFS